MSREKQEEKARRSKKKLMEAAAKLFNEKKIEDVWSERNCFFCLDDYRNFLLLF